MKDRQKLLIKTRNHTVPVKNSKNSNYTITTTYYLLVDTSTIS